MGSDSDFTDDVYREPWEHEGGGPADGRGKSSGRSTLLIVLIALGAGGLFLCCGGCAVFIYLFRPSFNDQPADVVAATQEMLDIEIPDQFEPAGTINWEFMSFITMKIAMYKAAAGDGMLMLAEMGGSVIAQAEADQQFDRMLEQQGQGNRKLEIESSETKEFEIDGETVKFVFSKGKEANSDKVFRQVTGIVPGKRGPVWMLLQEEDENYDEEAVTNLIESIGP